MNAYESKQKHSNADELVRATLITKQAAVLMDTANVEVLMVL